MVITFMLGNGFDKNCGMQTSFRDAYQGYLEEASSSPSINHFKNAIKSDIERWSDFEMELAEYVSSVASEQDILPCLRDFKAYLKNYLEMQQRVFHEKIVKAEEASVSKEMTYSINNFYKGITPNLTRSIDSMKSKADIYQAISFNYTDTFAYLYSRTYGIIDIVNVHGVLGRQCADLAVGLDNEGQLKDLNFKPSERMLRTLIKPTYNATFDEQRQKKATNMISNSTVICTFGLKLGESDLIWREKILDWLLDDTSNHLFYYSYKASQQHAETIDAQMDIEEDLKSDLLASWGLEKDARDSISNRIHIPVGSSIFNIKDICQGEKKTSETVVTV